MAPMLIMAAIDIFAPPFIYSPGILFAYMMNDAYEKPAISITLIWESFVAVFGFYIFSVVWGCLLFIKSQEAEKEKKEQEEKVDQVRAEIARADELAKAEEAITKGRK